MAIDSLITGKDRLSNENSMKIMTASLALTIICLGFSICGLAQSDRTQNTYQIGNKQIVIPAPAGFIEAASQIQPVKELFTATEASGNDLIAVHVPIEHFQLLKKGDSSDLTFYTKISVSKRLKTMTLSPADFVEFTTIFKKSFPELTDPQGANMKGILRSMSENLSELNKEKTTVTLAQPINLGLIEDSPNVYGTLLLMQMKVAIQGREVTRPLLSGLTAVRVRQKILFVYTYKLYEKEQDIAELKQFSKNWVGRIVAANKNAQ